MPRPIPSLVQLVLVITLAVGLWLLPISGWARSDVSWSSAIATTATVPCPRGSSAIQLATIEYACVVFNGEELFPVATTIPGEGTSDVTGALARSRTIAINLETVLNSDFDPGSLVVEPALLDNQTVLIAQDASTLGNTVLLTITELDAQLVRRPVESLARTRATVLEAALQDAYRERLPETQAANRRQALRLGGLTLLASLVLIGLQRYLKQRFSRVTHRLQDINREFRDALHQQDALAEGSNPNLANANRAMFHLRRRQNLNILVRRLLQFALVGLLFWGLLRVLQIFPQTRLLSTWLIDVPVALFQTMLLIFTLAQSCILVIRRYLQTQLEAASLQEERAQRMALRIPTLEGVFTGIVWTTASLIGLLWFLIRQQVDLSPILTGAGVFGALLGFIFQSLLKDWLNGTLIIFEDQYAVGDIVEINGITGFVEAMSIRATQLRSDGGRLTTLPHNQVNTVHNLTRDWSRVDFKILVANHSDLNRAMVVMRQVSQELQHAPDWQGDILNPTVIIGVSNVSSIGTELLMWIQTKRLRQWDVEREYRRRLTIAFAEAGIALGVPQQITRLEGDPRPLGNITAELR